jgi:hypothetical protein
MPSERAKDHKQNITKFKKIKQCGECSSADNDLSPVFIPWQGYFCSAVVYSADSPATEMKCMTRSVTPSAVMSFPWLMFSVYTDHTPVPVFTGPGFTDPDFLDHGCFEPGLLWTFAQDK